MATLVAGGAVRIDAAAASTFAHRVIFDLRAALGSVLDAIAERRRRLQALDAFDRIDPRTLKDLGIDRGRAMLAG